jgi:hypothetical protein
MDNRNVMKLRYAHWLLYENDELNIRIGKLSTNCGNAGESLLWW